MRMFGTFLCFFLLLLVMGTGSYVYLLWHHYWARVERLQREQQQHLNRRFYRGGEIFGVEAAADRAAPPDGGGAGFDEGGQYYAQWMAAQKEKSHTTTASPSPTTSTEAIPQDKLEAKVSHYQTQIISQFRNAVAETGRGVRLGQVKNSYFVTFKGNLSDNPREQMAPDELVCESLQQVKISTFLLGDAFFGGQHLDEYFWPRPPLSSESETPFESCGVVSSSGSLKGSGLGSRIDANDVVVRFNNAPTKGYERDVGTKTSLRIVNSQVVGKPEFRFLESGGPDNPLYSSAPVLVWDPAPYNASVYDWYHNPDYPFFETFFSKRLMRPREELHLLKPDSLWSIWDWLQRHTNHPLLPNPPSSGFLGLLLTLRHCRKVRVYEYVPSMRLTKRCHYYDEEENLGCTVGDWHPLAAEKLLALAMNHAPASDVFAEGFLEVRGAAALDCEGMAEEKRRRAEEEAAEGA